MEMTDGILLVVISIMLVELTYLVITTKMNVPFKKKHADQILLDTSVLIDGRIVSVAKTGFMGGTLVIPRSVVGELQFLADAADHDKRMRARFGLDVVAELQSIPNINVEILQDGNKADEGVDSRLLQLAKKYGASICTLDYNLNKVALVENINILNVNELAQSLRMAHLPGEKLYLELVQKGQDSHQAVGYLPDGTMVVVEHAVKMMGQTVEVEVIRSLQTAAGRMMFAKLLLAQRPAAKKQQATTPSVANPHQQSNKPLRPAPSRGRQYYKKRTSKDDDPESNLINLVKSQ